MACKLLILRSRFFHSDRPLEDNVSIARAVNRNDQGSKLI
jgi:hypothetical protein